MPDPAEIERAKSFFPTMPSEVFDLWICPLIDSDGWPFSSVNALYVDHCALRLSLKQPLPLLNKFSPPLLIAHDYSVDVTVIVNARPLICTPAKDEAEEEAQTAEASAEKS
jgi:hypothetical protein